MASDDETAPICLSGEEDDIPTDEDSVGSLAEFIVDTDEETEASESGSESGEDSEHEERDEDVEVEGTVPNWIDEKNIISGGRTRRKRKAPERYQDDNYLKLMISDSEASLSSSESEDGDDSEDEEFKYESDVSGSNESDSGGELKRSRVE